MKVYLALVFALTLFISSCVAPSGHNSQSWHPKPAKKARQGHNR